MLPGHVILDGRPAPILARSHDSFSVLGVISDASATWRPPSYGTSTRGSHIRCASVGGMWP